MGFVRVCQYLHLLFEALPVSRCTASDDVGRQPSAGANRQSPALTNLPGYGKLVIGCGSFMLSSIYLHTPARERAGLAGRRRGMASAPAKLSGKRIVLWAHSGELAPRDVAATPKGQPQFPLAHRTSGEISQVQGQSGIQVQGSCSHFLFGAAEGFRRQSLPKQ